MLLVITNSKTGKKNKSLKTTKKDNIRHGHGVQSVRKVVEKYNGTVSFTDKGDIFEVSAMLYGIEVRNKCKVLHLNVNLLHFDGFSCKV